MTVTWSAGIRNAMLDCWEQAIGPDALFRLYTGDPPTHVSDPQTGTKLAEFELEGDWSLPAAGGVKGIAALPLGTPGLALGIAGHYAIYASDGVTCHERGTITGTGGGGDAIINNTSIDVGQTVNLISFQKTMSGA